MATLAFAAIGAWVAPAGFAAMGWTVGSVVGAAALGALSGGQKMPDQVGPRMGDNFVQKSVNGDAIPRLFGWHRPAGNIVWMSEIREVESKDTESYGGKGLGSSKEVTTVTYSYYADVAISICGPSERIAAIYADDLMLYQDDGTTVTVADNFEVEIQLGGEDQLPSVTEEAALGAGNVPAYRGQTRVVISNFNLTKYGNRLPNFWFEVLGE